jgi:hypothetical protein
MCGYIVDWLFLNLGLGGRLLLVFLPSLLLNWQVVVGQLELGRLLRLPRLATAIVRLLGFALRHRRVESEEDVMS